MGMPTIGLGCMSMSQTDKPQQEMIQLLHSAIDSGVTFLDTSDLYGSDANELLNGQALKGGRRDTVQIATKFGIKSVSPETGLIVTGDPVYVKESSNGCLKRLGVDKRDVRPKVELATKFGISAENGAYEIYGNVTYVRAACEAILKPLEINCVDLYYQHCSDTRVPIEITV